MSKEIAWQDSLAAFHSFASHLPQRLEQPVTTYLDSGPWKIRFGRRGNAAKSAEPEDMSGDELTKYNAADCRVTIKAWKKLVLDPSFQSEKHVYEHDLMLFRMCADLHETGINVDQGMMRFLSGRLRTEADRLREKMAAIANRPDFNPKSHLQLREVLFQKLKVKTLGQTPSGNPTTSKILIEALRAEPDTPGGQFAELLSRQREYLKTRNTYLTPVKSLIFEANSGDGERAHFSWGPREKRDEKTSGGGHTVSGRLASRFQSLPRYNPRNIPDQIRKIYIPRDPSHCFLYFDVKQGEPRVAAFLSGDPVRIEICKGDVHANNAKVMFPDIAERGWLDGAAMKDPTKGKPCRDLAKNMGLAIDYFAEAERVYAYLLQNRFGPDGKPLYGLISLRTVNAIIAKIRFKYKVYVKFVHDNQSIVKKSGCMRDPILGRIRWLGRHAAITDVANYPIQSCLAAVMNLRCLALHYPDRFEIWRRKYPEPARLVNLPRVLPKWPGKAKMAAQVHDSCTYDTPKKLAQGCWHILEDIWGREIDLPGGKLVLPIDLKIGERYSEL